MSTLAELHERWSRDPEYREAYEQLGPEYQGVDASGCRYQEGVSGKVTMERTDLGCEIETALGEVLAHVRGETGLSCRIVDNPAASRRAPQAVAAEPAEVRRSLRSRCEGSSGMGTGPARSRSCSPGCC